MLVNQPRSGYAELARTDKVTDVRLRRRSGFRFAFGRTEGIEMRWIVAVVAVALGTTSASADDPPTWKEFASTAGGFKVLIPGTPKQYTLDAESDFGKGVLHMNTVQAGKTMYGANYCDFPAGIRMVPLKKVYDSSRDGAVANLEGKLASEKDIKLGEHPGREIRIDLAGGKQLFRVRVYLVNQRLYQVVVMGTKEAATSKEADKFLDSFKLASR
jgi:hypothetical protein